MYTKQRTVSRQMFREHACLPSTHARQAVQLRNLTLVCCVVERQAESVAGREQDVAQREASLQNEQEQLRQQQALLEESSQAVDKERLEAREMLKVSGSISLSYIPYIQHLPRALESLTRLLAGIVHL